MQTQANLLSTKDGLDTPWSYFCRIGQAVGVQFTRETLETRHRQSFVCRREFFGQCDASLQHWAEARLVVKANKAHHAQRMCCLWMMLQAAAS